MQKKLKNAKMIRARKSEFTPDLDKRLIWCVQQAKYRQMKKLRDGTETEQIAWSHIAKDHFTNEKFSTQKLFQRWNRCLNPALRHGTWTENEDKLLLNLFKKIGPKWSKISEAMGFTRCDVWCRARYNKLVHGSSVFSVSNANLTRDVC